jgi:hypothetical protein
LAFDKAARGLTFSRTGSGFTDVLPPFKMALIFIEQLGLQKSNQRPMNGSRELYLSRADIDVIKARK